MDFTHFNDYGYAKMVDVTGKESTHRIACAGGFISMHPDTLALITEGRIKKGDVLSVAQVAGIMASKRTHEIIPMCHPILITGVDIDFTISTDPCGIEIQSTVHCKGETGVEMEALMAVSAATLTIYDMCKAVQRDMKIENIRLLSKSGGKSGDFTAGE